MAEATHAIQSAQQLTFENKALRSELFARRVDIRGHYGKFISVSRRNLGIGRKGCLATRRLRVAIQDSIRQNA